MTHDAGFPVRAIDVVVNPLTPEIVAARPDWTRRFHTAKIGRPAGEVAGVTHEEMIARLDAAGIERAFLISCKLGPQGVPGCWHMPDAWIAEAVAARPDRFSGLVGLDPTEGMAGVRRLERAVREQGFIGAHCYPHWFELPPDDARWWPFYAKCCELGVPIQMQVGQSLVYDPARPLRSVGRPIAIDPVACWFPELKIVGIHIGVPWHDEMIAMAWKHENVFIGTDAHAPKHWPRSFVRFLDSYGRRKVLFGTDWPVIDFARAMREIAALGLREETLRAVLRDNALRVYGLDDDRQGGTE